MHCMLSADTDIERIEEKREMNPGMDAIYILSPTTAHRRLPDGRLRAPAISKEPSSYGPPSSIRRCAGASIPRGKHKEQLAGFETLSIDYFPRESHLITFRDPWSFPILYHPACNNLVRDHMQILAQKVGISGMDLSTD
jgi:syntaxin-binding protein 1